MEIHDKLTQELKKIEGVVSDGVDRARRTRSQVEFSRGWHAKRSVCFA